MLTVFFSVLLAVSVFIASDPALAQPGNFNLQTLIDEGGEIPFGDKLFSNFTATLSGVDSSPDGPASGFTPADLSGVTVTPVLFGGDALGLNFAGPFGASVLGTQGDFATLSFDVAFDVSVLSPGLAINFVGFGTFGGSGSVDLTLSPPGGFITPTTLLHMSAELDLARFEPGEASLDSFTLAFPQIEIPPSVPEPSVFIQLGVGLIALGCRRLLRGHGGAPRDPTSRDQP